MSALVWAVTSFCLFLPLGVGIILAANSSGEFWAARGCFVFAVLSLVWTYLAWLKSDHQQWARRVAGTSVLILVVLGTPGLLYWVNVRKETGLVRENQLLERAVNANYACSEYKSAALSKLLDDMVQLVKRVPDRESRKPLIALEMEQSHLANMRLYDQAYKQEFMEVHRLLALNVPTRGNAEANFENPKTSEDISNICDDLFLRTKGYIDLLSRERKLNPEDQNKYTRALLNRR